MVPHTARIAAVALVAMSCVAAPAQGAETVHLFNVERMSQLAVDDRTGALAQFGIDYQGRRGVVLRSFDRSSGFQLDDDRFFEFDRAFAPVDVALEDLGGRNTLIVLGETGRVQAIRFEVKDGVILVPEIDNFTLDFSRAERVSRLAVLPPDGDRRTPALAAAGGDTVHLAHLAAPDGADGVVSHEEQYSVPGNTITDVEPLPRDGEVQLATLADGIMVIAVLRPEGPELTARFSDPLRDRDPDVPQLLDLAAPCRVACDLSDVRDGTSSTITAGANGTANLLRYEVPAGGTTGSLILREVQQLDQPIKQVVVGSLTMLAADGSGVAYSRAWTPFEPTLGNLWTIGGGTAELDPERLNASSRGRYATLRVEVAEARATAIDHGTLRVVAGGTDIPAETSPAPALVFADGDRNPELEFKVSRAALLGALTGRTGEVPLSIHWEQIDGTPGRAAAVARLG